tara:strand:- start:10 stop:1581 length:1572 start_codon:yes stop_codon:yes gene_type:complete
MQATFLTHPALVAGLAMVAPSARTRLPARTATVTMAHERTDIYCNRAINMESIQAIGFDMDYTLAEYYEDTFDLLAFDGAKAKLVTLGYPEEVANFKYDAKDYQRGLVLDKKRGNMLKMDRHKYVKVAYHGLTPLTRDERQAIYASSFESQEQFIPPAFASVDTAFMLVDVSLFCQLVDYKDRHPDVLPQSYADLYKDVRHAVDLCHCDGVIKDQVALEPAKYIKPSPELPRMLRQLRAGGKQVFIVTNSLFDFTNVVMKFLLGESWTDHFDLVISGARKPGFLLDSYLPLFLVREDNSLENVEIGSAFEPKTLLAQSKVFQGGNWNHLHRLLGLTSGANLMYVGDHMYSDILRSKRTLGWRTVLIIPELDHEVEQMEIAEERRRDYETLRDSRAEMQKDLEIHSLRQLQLKIDGAEGDELDELQTQTEALSAQIAEMNDELSASIQDWHEDFHPVWGAMLKAGHQNSKWAQQVETYACLYTSRVTNLAYTMPDTRFRVYSDMMPHDRYTFAAAEAAEDTASS